jgi:hypothetical protein
MPSELSEAEQKRRALALMLDTWEKALGEGAAPDLIASVALFAALTDMVDRYGQEAVAEFCASLPERVRGGEFSLAEQAGG